MLDKLLKNINIYVGDNERTFFFGFMFAKELKGHEIRETIFLYCYEKFMLYVEDLERVFTYEAHNFGGEQFERMPHKTFRDMLTFLANRESLSKNKLKSMPTTGVPDDICQGELLFT